MANYAIGDVQGCFFELKGLLGLPQMLAPNLLSTLCFDLILFVIYKKWSYRYQKFNVNCYLREHFP